MALLVQKFNTIRGWNILLFYGDQRSRSVDCQRSFWPRSYPACRGVRETLSSWRAGLLQLCVKKYYSKIQEYLFLQLSQASIAARSLKRPAKGNILAATCWSSCAAATVAPWSFIRTASNR